MNTSRNGKIGGLPREVREQLNRRLADAEPVKGLVDWLNGRPEVRQVLDEQFGGRKITEKNISDWKLNGHLEWLAQQETLDFARESAGEARELTKAADGSLAEHLAVGLALRYAKLMAGWDGEMDEAFQGKLRGLERLCLPITRLRRGDLAAAKGEAAHAAGPGPGVVP